VDYSYAAMKIFEKNIGDEISFLRHDITLGFPWISNEFFDIIIMADVLEHIHHENLIYTSQDILRITKKRGFVFIDTPILAGANSELHVNVRGSVSEVKQYFPETTLLDIRWFKNPEHCNLTFQKN
jgi:2-polyprenyl-3-methyl-5-hydroxy-6-metoxy-1,4-benzoquinol methylase